ncbi:MAG: DUF4367 domain-containing protein [Lachnospiraceae bacterium]|nr:DUF4367 domain-containing protein [Lachnospiraceae bacterium]
MSEDRKRLEEQVLKQSIPVSKITEDKIQAAYDIVRAKSRQKAKATPMRSRRSLRHVWAAGLAAALIAVSGLGVMASMGYFTKNVQEADGKVSYSFEVNYELKPVEVKAEPTYLPEGMIKQEEGKYFFEGNYGHGISIMPMNMVNIDAQKEMLDFSHVEQVEKTTIGNMEAHIITYQEPDKYLTGEDLFLFNPEDGYVIRIFADYGVLAEEVKKVAEGLKITVTESEDLTYGLTPEEQQKQAAAEAGDAQWESLVEKGVTIDQITKPGETLKCEGYGASYTVNDVKIYDSLFDVPGYTEQGVYDLERLSPWLNADGTHKSYQRMHLDQEGEILEETTATPKFLAVQVTAEQYIGYDEFSDGSTQDSTALDARLVYVEKRADGTWNFRKDTYEAVPGERYELQMDASAFYLSCPKNINGEERLHSFFYRSMAKGESIDYTLIFAVDADRMPSDSLANIVLCFNGTGNDETNPMWSALTEMK